MTQRWKWTPEIGARTARAEERVRDRWASRLEARRRAFWEDFDTRKPGRNYAQTIGAVMGMEPNPTSLDLSDPDVRKAVWRKKLTRHMLASGGMTAEAVNTLWKGFETKDPDAEEEIRLFDVEMRTVEDAAR